MSAILEKFASCFNFQTFFKYKKLPITKKNDDLGIAEATEWVQAHAVKVDIAYKTSKEILDYVNSIIKDLQKFPINQSNKEIVEKHLITIATYSNVVRKEMASKIASCKGDKSIIFDIQISFASLISLLP